LRVTIANNFVMARHTVYVRKVLHADPCHMWPEHGIDEMTLRCRTFQKILLFLKFCSHTS